jgi:myo-inositol-1(or 4)-monophosphatase
MPNFWNEILEFCQATTTEVGDRLLTDFGQVQASEKSDGSLVTRSDQRSDQQLREAIANRFPEHGVLSEEGEHLMPATDWCWIIDPLDGTTNFARGIPIWAISLGLLYRGTPVFGYVHLPPLRQTFHGFWQATDHANGAFMNGQLIKTRMDAPGGNQFFSLCARSTKVLQQSFPCKIRMLGSSCYNFLTVASGATLGGTEATPKIWDIAAAWVIVQAAGGSWVALDQVSSVGEVLDKGTIFPLEVGKSYGDRSYPTLVTSQDSLVPFFLPLITST